MIKITFLIFNVAGKEFKMAKGQIFIRRPHMTYMEVKIHIGAGTIHRVLIIYNGLAVLLLAGFMAVTQQKINQSMWAHQFLQQVPGVPLPAETMLLNTLISFVVLTGCGYLYSHLTEISVMWRSGLFILELASCIFFDA